MHADRTDPQPEAPMSDLTADADLTASVRGVLDRIRYLVLGTVDDDGRPRTSPVYFVPHRYQELYWVSHPESHHSRNLHRDARATAVVFDSTVPPGPDARAVYLTGTAAEIPQAELVEHLTQAFEPRRGGRAFAAEELTGDADLRLWVLHVEGWDAHVPAGHQTLGTGTDRRVAVDPRTTG
jgi:nitroimidazol reductase NimA-like FMN-containing flavoprotein (pyridoxamine 5'-phosphate oxidase superfamily)